MDKNVNQKDFCVIQTYNLVICEWKQDTSPLNLFNSLQSSLTDCSLIHLIKQIKIQNKKVMIAII